MSLSPFAKLMDKEPGLDPKSPESHSPHTHAGKLKAADQGGGTGEPGVVAPNEAPPAMTPHDQGGGTGEPGGKSK